jgi:alanine racemase
MTLTLHVDGGAWRARVRTTAEAHDDVIAVVKGNGYGFGRSRLAAEALALGLNRLAVGTVHELAGLPPTLVAPIVLTPAVGADVALGAGAVLTIGSPAHVRAAGGHRAPVVVKLASSMQRYGVGPDGLDDLLALAASAGLSVGGFALHLPLAGEPGPEIEAWLGRLPAGASLAVSHVDPVTLHDLRARHPDHPLPVRLGTALWHGNKESLALRADVVEVRPAVTTSAGYRGRDLPGPGTLVMVGAGTAHGVHPLPDGRSPFHFARRRLALVEPPHMHTSMVWIPSGEPVPTVGDEVDVQVPLTYVQPDRVQER